MAHDLIVPVRQPIRDAITPIGGAVLYGTERYDPDTEIKIPHVWLYSDSETPGTSFYGWLENTATLHIWARSLTELQALEDAVAFLDDHRSPSNGTALNPQWSMQSKTRLPEDEGIWHTTIIYLVRYADARNLSTV